MIFFTVSSDDKASSSKSESDVTKSHQNDNDKKPSSSAEKPVTSSHQNDNDGKKK